MEYYLNLYTGETWKEFIANGGSVSGFRESRWLMVQRIKPGDILLAYMTGVSRFIAIQEILSGGYRDNTPIWSREVFPCRVKVRNLAVLTPETAVPISDLLGKLSISGHDSASRTWSGRVRSSPSRWSPEDGRVVVEAVEAAMSNPVSRPVDPKKLEYKPRGTPSSIGIVAVPERDDDECERSSKS